MIQELTALSPDQLTLQTSLADCGLDSLAVAELVVRLDEAGAELSDAAAGEAWGRLTIADLHRLCVV
jgi:acyl carrier protein